MIKICLSDYLSDQGISAYRLAKETQGKAARNSIYALARGDMQRVDLETLNTVMQALENMTGQAPSFDDLFERIEPQNVEINENAMLESGLSDYSANLADLESDLSSEELTDWLEAYGV